MIYCDNCGAELPLQAEVSFAKILRKTTRLADGRLEVELLYNVPLCEECAKDEKELINYE